MSIAPTGTLYIVATPIGNLEDITLRALHILKQVAIIAAEDTRHSRKLLSYYDIGTPLVSYYREKEQERGAELVARMLAGDDVALISDAGTPAISDPGSILVQLAHQAGIRVSPIPGPSALTAALSAAGLTDPAFTFLGFPPAKKSQRRTLLSSLVHMAHPVVLYESPRRVGQLLHDIKEILGDRDIVWARELTKSFEEVRLSPVSELLARYREQPPKGELVLVIAPGRQQQPSGDTIEELLAWYRDHSNLSMKDACRKLATDLGLSRSGVYQQALAIWHRQDPNNRH